MKDIHNQDLKQIQKVTLNAVMKQTTINKLKDARIKKQLNKRGL